MKHHIITISRQYGSGGMKIAKKLAENLGIAYYDKEVFLKLHEGEEYSEEARRQIELKNRHSVIYNLGASLGFSGVLTGRQFERQRAMIEELADRGESCVIVGRCADYILRDREHVTSIFLYADEDFRMKKAVEEYGIDLSEVKSWMTISDRIRQNYYNNHTGGKWGAAENYHLSIDTAYIDPDRIVKLIEKYVELRA